jgi:hypothetical protein
MSPFDKALNMYNTGWVPTIGVRLTEEQHQILLGRAGQQPVSTFIKEQLGLNAPGPSPIEELGLRVDDVERRVAGLEALAAGQGAYS